MNQPIYHLNTVNINTLSSWFDDQPTGGTALNVVNVTQLEKDTLLICLESKLFLVSDICCDCVQCSGVFFLRNS